MTYIKKRITFIASFILLSLLLVSPNFIYGISEKSKHPKYCKVGYGYFFTKIYSDSDSPIPVGAPIPFDSDGIHTNSIKRVIDNTFNIGGSAIAVFKPGVYQVTFGVSASEISPTSEVYLSVNNQIDFTSETTITANANGLISLTVFIKITHENIKNGQDGAALVQVLVHNNPLYLGTDEIGHDDVTAYISFLFIGDICKKSR